MGDFDKRIYEVLSEMLIKQDVVSEQLINLNSKVETLNNKFDDLNGKVDTLNNEVKEINKALVINAEQWVQQQKFNDFFYNKFNDFETILKGMLKIAEQYADLDNRMKNLEKQEARITKIEQFLKLA